MFFLYLMQLMPFRIRKTSKGTRNKILTGTYFHVKLQCSQQSSPKRRKKVRNIPTSMYSYKCIFMCFKYKSYNEDYSTNDDEEKSQIEYDIKNIFKSEKKQASNITV